MFDSPLPIRLAHIANNKSDNESFIRQFIYVFFIKDNMRKVKYIACVKQYDNQLLTIEFYAKIHAKDKYKILTNQFKFGHIGSTILRIMNEIQVKIGISCFGILSASLLNELDNLSNKRYRVYVNILQRKIDPDKFLVTGVPENSYIFIMPFNLASNSEQIYLQYETIFKETN